MTLDALKTLATQDQIALLKSIGIDAEALRLLSNQMRENEALEAKVRLTEAAELLGSILGNHQDAQNVLALLGGSKIAWDKSVQQLTVRGETVRVQFTPGLYALAKIDHILLAQTLTEYNIQSLEFHNEEGYACHWQAYIQGSALRIFADGFDIVARGERARAANSARPKNGEDLEEIVISGKHEVIRGRMNRARTDAARAAYAEALAIARQVAGGQIGQDAASKLFHAQNILGKILDTSVQLVSEGTLAASLGR